MTEFPPFRLDTVNQCLWRGDGVAEERILLAPKAFAVLRYLVEHPGRLVTHDELFEALWPKTHVQPEVLKSHIAAIRTVLGDDARKPLFIETRSRRGYRFIASVTEGAAARASRPTNLPEAVSELIGREAELGAVTAMATAHRLVSLVGAGGIGKTRLGLEVARHLLPRFPDGVFVAELGPVSSPELVPTTVASALGLTHVAGTASPQRVAVAVRAKTLLLVIDNCEHVIDAAAGMAETLLHASPGVSLLATSREPLRVSGEYIYRVPPLGVPAEDNQDMGRCVHARRRQALRVAGTCRGATIRCRRGRRGGDGRHLPAPRRDPARDRARRDAHRGVRCRWGGRPPGRPLQAARGGQPHATPSPDDARDARLEL